MMEKKYPGLFEVPLPRTHSNDIIPLQAKLNMDLNQQILSLNMAEKQKNFDFIKKTNKSFFQKFGKLYSKNIILKAKLKDLCEEKKKLNQRIIKLEKQRGKDFKIEKEKKVGNSKDIHKKANILSFYRKKKRIRRKKSEIKYIYSCDFPFCKKRYPTKGSLNMHKKLKHQNKMYMGLKFMDK